MKTKKAYLVIVILLLGSFIGNNVCAQCSPGTMLPSLKAPYDDYYDFQYGNKGFVRAVGIGADTPMDQRCYSICTGNGGGERFRVSASGTVSIITPYTFPAGTLSTAALSFYEGSASAAYKYLGGIFCNTGKMAISGCNGIDFWGIPKNTGTPHLSIKADGSVLIGQVKNHQFAFNVGGSIYTESSGIQTYFGKDTDHDDAWIGTISKNGLYLGTNGKSSLYLDVDNNNTYIGLRDVTVAQIRQELKKKYCLIVAKGVLSEDYGIGPHSSWSDFVFNKDYALKTIPEVEEFISENNHLPDVPSAKQVAEEGYSQHDMNKVLLQKIEELTLYTIQQQKEIQELKTELNNLKK